MMDGRVTTAVRYDTINQLGGCFVEFHGLHSLGVRRVRGVRGVRGVEECLALSNSLTQALGGMSGTFQSISGLPTDLRKALALLKTLQP